MNRRQGKRLLLLLALGLGGGVVWLQQHSLMFSPQETPLAQGGPVDQLEIFEYQIQPGETLTQIAQRLAVSLEQLVSSNEPLLADLAELEPGQVLRLVKGGVLHRVKSGQTLTDIAQTYRVSVEEIIMANDLTERRYIYAGEELFIPGASDFPAWRRFQLANGQSVLFSWPLQGTLTSAFGPRRHPLSHKPDFHAGIDLEVPTGTEVYAARAGRVVFAGRRGGYGLTVIVKHDHGYQTVYAHLSELFVYRGQFIEGGQRLALSGNTGNSTGPHLHFEIWQYGRPLNPLALLPSL